MSYITNNLLPNEEVQVTAKVNIIAFVPSILLALLVFIVSIITGSGLYIFFGLVVAAAIIAVVYIRMKSVELGITNKKIVGKVGVFNTKSLDAYLTKIDNISISQNFWGKILGYATIQVNTTSGVLRFPGISNAEEVKKTASIQIEKYTEEAARFQAQCIAEALTAKLK